MKFPGHPRRDCSHYLFAEAQKDLRMMKDDTQRSTGESISIYVTNTNSFPTATHLVMLTDDDYGTGANGKSLRCAYVVLGALQLFRTVFRMQIANFWGTRARYTLRRLRATTQAAAHAAQPAQCALTQRRLQLTQRRLRNALSRSAGCSSRSAGCALRSHAAQAAHCALTQRRLHCGIIIVVCCVDTITYCITSLLPC